MVAPYSGAMFAIVARSARLRCADTFAVKLDETSDDTLGAKHLRDGKHQIGRGRAFRKLALST